MKDLKKVRKMFDTYITKFPIIGYNSSKCDLNFIKKSLPHALNSDIDGHVIRKQNSYTSIAAPEIFDLSMRFILN